MRTLIALMSFLAVSAAAQAQFFMRAGVSYAMPLAGQTMTGATSLYNGMIMPYSGTRSNAGSVATYQLKNVSFSAGVNSVLGVGYLFSKNVGVQVDAIVGMASPEYSFSDKLTYIYYTSGPLLSNVSMTHSSDGMLLMAPSLLLQSGGDKLNIYTRFGVALPLASAVNQELTLENAPGTGAKTTDRLSFRLTHSFSPGISAAGGVQYFLNSRTSIWAEASVLSLSMNVKQSEFTAFSENGISYPTSAIGFPEKVKYSHNAVADSTGLQMPTYAQPFSHFGISIGVSFGLSGSKSNVTRKDRERLGRRRED